MKLFLSLYFEVAHKYVNASELLPKNTRNTHGSHCRYLTIWISLYYGRLKSALSFYNSLVHVCLVAFFSMCVYICPIMRACVRSFVHVCGWLHIETLHSVNVAIKTIYIIFLYSYWNSTERQHAALRSWIVFSLKYSNRFIFYFIK